LRRYADACANACAGRRANTAGDALSDTAASAAAAAAAANDTITNASANADHYRLDVRGRVPGAEISPDLLAGQLRVAQPGTRSVPDCIQRLDMCLPRLGDSSQRSVLRSGWRLSQRAVAMHVPFAGQFLRLCSTEFERRVFHHGMRRADARADAGANARANAGQLVREDVRAQRRQHVPEDRRHIRGRYVPETALSLGERYRRRRR
jgi:hypothetical protein